MFFTTSSRCWSGGGSIADGVLEAETDQAA